jgi:hypothetical protein
MGAQSGLARLEVDARHTLGGAGAPGRPLLRLKGGPRSRERAALRLSCAVSAYRSGIPPASSLLRGIGCGVGSADNRRVRRVSAIALLLLFALPVGALAQASGRFRPEQKSLRSADVALAKRTTVRAADLSSGWVRTAPNQSPDQKLDCPGVDLDFSRFTITGTARTKFEQAGASIESYVEVYKSRADAAGDFRKGSQPGALACIARLLDKEARRDGRSRVVAARSLADPPVGDQAMAYRIVLSVATDSGAVRVYVDFLGFQRGRTAVLLAFTAARDPITRRVPLARTVVARAR